MSRFSIHKMITAILGAMLASLAICSCSATGDEFESSPISNPTTPAVPDSTQKGESGADDPEKADPEGDPSLESTMYALFKWVKIPETSISRGETVFTVDSFHIATTEVTQLVYETVMGTLPTQKNSGDAYPVESVSWYDAVLFCNAYSKKMGLDTVYEYASVGAENYLENLRINYEVKGVRLPTETEWEVAARAGTSTTYYWDTEKASEYAYYGQTKGPSEVGKFKPNAYGLFDMGGNVAEWVNDWYGSYATKDTRNPVGPDNGSARCVRGGGWTDKVVAMASKERDKKVPLTKSVSLGFRVVLSQGF